MTHAAIMQQCGAHDIDLREAPGQCAAGSLCDAVDGGMCGACMCE